MEGAFLGGRSVSAHGGCEAFPLQAVSIHEVDAPGPSTQYHNTHFCGTAESREFVLVVVSFLGCRECPSTR